MVCVVMRDDLACWASQAQPNLRGLFVPSGGVGGSANITFNLSSGQVALQGGVHGLLGAGIYAGAGVQGGVGVSKGPLTTGSSVYWVAEGGIGAGPSVGGQIQGAADGLQVSTGAGRVGAGYGVYSAAGIGKQWTLASPPLWDSVSPVQSLDSGKNAGGQCRP